MSASGGKEVQPGGMEQHGRSPLAGSGALAFLWKLCSLSRGPVFTQQLDSEWVMGGSRVRLTEVRDGAPQAHLV